MHIFILIENADYFPGVRFLFPLIFKLKNKYRLTKRSSNLTLNIVSLILFLVISLRSC